MSLSVVQFYSLRPHLPFRYKTEWFLGFWDAKQKEILSYAVTSVTLPKIEIENNNGSSYFGNGFINMPTFSPGTRKLEITFEETDYMLVSRTIDELVKRSYSNKPYYITIAITQFNEHFHQGITKGYICHLASYEEPQFKRDGQAQAITVSASFIVDTVIDSFTADKAVSGNVNVRQAGEYNTSINTLVIDDQNQDFKYGNLRLPVDTSQFGGGTYGGQNRYKQAAAFKSGGTVAATRGGGTGYSNFEVNSAFNVVYDTSKGTMTLYDDKGNIIKQTTKAFTSNKGKETEKCGSIPKGKYIMNNDANSHNQGKNTRERNGEKVNANAMSLYGVQGSAGDTLQTNNRAGINMHYGENSNWSEGCAVTPDVEFMNTVSEMTGNSNIMFTVI